MLKTITSSDLRVQIKQVLNEVGYGQDQYIVEKFGEPTAAIISMADFRMLQAVRHEQTAASLSGMVETVRRQYGEIEIDELAELIEQAGRINAAIDSGQMGTIAHDDLRQLLRERQA